MLWLNLVESPSAGVVLTDAMHLHVDRVFYDYSSTSPTALVQEVAAALHGRRADSIALIVVGTAGRLLLLGPPQVPPSPSSPSSPSFSRSSGSVHGNGGGTAGESQIEVVLSAESIESDPVARECVQGLAAHVKGGRIDFLATAAASEPGGKRLHQKLQGLCGNVVVVLSSHVGSSEVSIGRQRSVGDAAPLHDVSAEDPGVSHGVPDIGTVYEQYFNLAQLRHWAGPHTQTLAEYDRVRTVGRGAFGSAVLYRRLDDRKYVILKEVDLHTLTVKERQLALNEHVVLGMLDHPNIIKYALASLYAVAGLGQCSGGAGTGALHARVWGR